MMQRGTRLASTAKWAMFAALAVGAFGCELIATVDRSKIDGSGGSGGSGGSTASSTSTGMVECTKPEECTDPMNECVTRTCDGGKCGTSPVASGTRTAAQTAGDCKATQCDGNGATTSVNDDTDVNDDKMACTDDSCAAGVPSNKPSAAGTSCGANLTCDGKGTCTGCAAATDCPGTDTECAARTCTAGVCGVNNAPAGTPTNAQTAGDCQKKQCDGNGAIVSMPDNADLPVDANDCTDNICTGGVPSNPNTMSGNTCSTPAGGKCNGSGSCVECLVASTCPGMDTECATRTCNMGVCGISLVPAGTATAMQSTGDCKKVTCNGAGSTTSVNDDTDIPNDSNACTGDVCTAGVPTHPLQPVGTVCGSGQTCNATGTCVGCTTATDCPMAANPECAARTCVANACGFANTPVGTATTTQTAGDCKKITCDGLGGTIATNDDTDLPNDNNQCTTDTCTAGAPSNPSAPANTACTQMSGTLCNGSGACVACLVANDCPGVNTDCKARTCTAGLCGTANTPAGTITSTQTPGDCQENQCDGAGATTSVAKNTDLPSDDGNQCTSETCTAGAPSYPAVASGTVCNQGGGTVCITGTCSAPSCTDGFKDGTETDTDCGGGTCPACGTGKVCTANSDCSTSNCAGNVCSLVNGCDPTTATDMTASTTATITFANGNFSYAPKCLKVKAGTAVTFNGNFAGHPLQGGTVMGSTVTPASSGPFATLVNTGSTAMFTMSSSGSYPYYCTAHAVSQQMYGAIFVVP